MDAETAFVKELSEILQCAFGKNAVLDQARILMADLGEFSGALARFESLLGLDHCVGIENSTYEIVQKISALKSGDLEREKAVRAVRLRVAYEMTTAMQLQIEALMGER